MDAPRFNWIVTFTVSPGTIFMRWTNEGIESLLPVNSGDRAPWENIFVGGNVSRILCDHVIFAWRDARNCKGAIHPGCCGEERAISQNAPGLLLTGDSK